MFIGEDYRILVDPVYGLLSWSMQVIITKRNRLR